MCVIIAVPEGVELPTAEVLHACEQGNPDGGGLAWVEGEGANRWVHWKKGITAAIINEMIQERKDSGSSFLIHFRIASVGATIPELCHPFPVTATAPTDLEGRAKLVLAHNGTWSGWKDVLLRSLKGKIRGEWSDSRAMAYLAGNYGKDTLKLIDEKIVTLGTDNELMLYNYKRWDKDEKGRYFSNMFWKSRTVYSTGGSKSNDFWERGYGGYGRYRSDTSEYPTQPAKGPSKEQSTQASGVKVETKMEAKPDVSLVPIQSEEDKEYGEITVVSSSPNAPVNDEVTTMIKSICPDALDKSGGFTDRMRAALAAISDMPDKDKEMLLPGWAEVAMDLGKEAADQLCASDMLIVSG